MQLLLRSALESRDFVRVFTKGPRVGSRASLGLPNKGIKELGMVWHRFHRGKKNRKINGLTGETLQLPQTHPLIENNVLVFQEGTAQGTSARH